MTKYFEYLSAFKKILEDILPRPFFLFVEFD